MQLTKHHALGNDFLVLIDIDGTTPITADVARAVCHRRHGVGADGVMRVTATGDQAVPFVMELFNSDGSIAEMSGNGMRCLVQALVMADAAPGPDFVVRTVGGDRAVSHRLGRAPGESTVSVDMGPATPGSMVSDDFDHRHVPDRLATIDIGNPHVVLVAGEPDAVDLAVEGPFYENQVVGGANIEWVAVEAQSRLRMRVWERGAGITQACGTGACASAVAAHSWGLVGSDVTVDMPGGSVDVGVADTVTLTGSANFVAAIEIDPGFLDCR